MSRLDLPPEVKGTAAALDLGGATTAGRNILRASDAAAQRAAMGAAPSAGAMELVAGANITLASATDLTIAAQWGEQVGPMPSIPRLSVTNNALTTATGNLRLSYFTANRAAVFTKIRAVCGGTAAAATPSLIRFGLYAVAANGDLTLGASTASDTSLFATISTPVSKALSATFTTVPGQRYALALLVVTAAAAPTAHGVLMLNAAEAALDPRVNGNVASQTDLPSTITSASVAASTTNLYLALEP